MAEQILNILAPFVIGLQGLAIFLLLKLIAGKDKLIERLMALLHTTKGATTSYESINGTEQLCPMTTEAARDAGGVPPAGPRKRPRWWKQ